jgi:hypothetical protein
MRWLKATPTGPFTAGLYCQQFLFAFNPQVALISG